MDILPAIDLLDGRCVRLIQGRYDRVINYDNDPLEVAGRFACSGARWLHVIDLDGARAGEIRNLAAVRRIVAETGVQVQFGGGVRDEAAIDAALEAGARRVIVGTRALQDWDWFERVAREPRHAGRIALGLDARVGKLAVAGWTRDTEKTALEVVRAVADWPLAGLVYTDIGRDGLLLGPNLNVIEMVARAATVPVFASGGVVDLEDVLALSRIAVQGVVIGRALYEGSLKLEDALAVAAQ